jgi:hypothetical protein
MQSVSRHFFIGLALGLTALSLGLTRAPAPRGKARGAVWLSTNPGKRAGELLALQLSPLWIASVGAHLRGLRVTPRGRPARSRPRPQAHAAAAACQALLSRVASTSAGARGAT